MKKVKNRSKCSRSKAKRLQKTKRMNKAKVKK